MMTDFKVYCRFSRGYIKYQFTSKVYAIDYKNNRFLVADPDGEFQWVDMDYCVLKEDENGDK